MIWLEEHDELMKSLKKRGKSYEEIAAALNLQFELTPALTRNAICGRVSRLGLSNQFGSTNIQRAAQRRVRDEARQKRIADEERAKAEKQAQEPKKPRREVVPGITKEEAQAYDAAASKVAPADWDGVSCAFPIGDPRQPEFGYCAAPETIGIYCEHHTRRTRSGSVLRTPDAPKEA